MALSRDVELRHGVRDGDGRQCSHDYDWQVNEHVGPPCDEKKPPRTSLTSLGARRLRLYLSLAAIDESDRWIEDHLVSRLGAADDFDTRAKITFHFHLVHLRLAIVDNRHLDSVAVEEERIGRHQKARRLARDTKLDGAVNAGRERAVGIGNIDFGQERAGAALQRLGYPGYLAAKLAIAKFGNAHDGFNARRHAKCRILGHVNRYADDVLLHDLEHEGAACGIALHQAPDIDIALGDNTIEGRDDRCIVPVLPQHFE